MNTTTTTTAAAVDKPALFAAAHAETRAWIFVHPTDSYRAVFAAALRAAYADAMPAAVVWAKMSDDEKYRALCAMVNYCRRRDSAECDKRGNPRAPRMRWIVTNDDVLTCAAEAFTRLDGLFARHPDKPLAIILYKAVNAAAQFIDRAEHRHDNVTRVSVIRNADGTESKSTFAEIVDVLAEPFPSPERTVIAREMLRAACHDRTDKLIIAALLDGKKKIDIADDLNISPAAVSQRLGKMLKRYHGAENVG